MTTTTIIIPAASDELVAAVQQFVAEHSSGGVRRVTRDSGEHLGVSGAETGTTVAARMNTESDVAPTGGDRVAPPGEVPAGAWLDDEINLLLRYLEMDGSHVQAEAIRRARVSANGMISREEIQSMPERRSEGMHGFVKPIKRLTRHLIGWGLLPERSRGDVLTAVYIQGTAIGYRVIDNIIIDGSNSDAGSGGA